MGDHKAFFYGTLMAPQVLYRVCYGSPTPSAFQMSLLTIRPAILHSYCRRRVKRCEYPAMIPAPNSSVRGTFVEGLTDADLWRLDIFEGSEYTRKEVLVRLLDKVGDEEGHGNVEGEEVSAETYIWAEGLEYLENSEWDFGEFRREKLYRWSGGNEQYEEVDEAVKAQGKDPRGGRGVNGSISRQLDAKNAEEALESAV